MGDGRAETPGRRPSVRVSPMFAILSRAVDALARAVALAGGLVLIGVIVATCISIAGRSLVGLGLGLGPISGMFDWTEIGVGFAIFCFLPWCHLARGHASVDLFQPAYPPLLNRVLDVAIDVAMLVVAIIIAWRLYLGMLDKQRYGETTFIAQVPVWTAYAAGLVGAVAFVIVAAFCVLRSGRALAGRAPAGLAP